MKIAHEHGGLSGATDEGSIIMAEFDVGLCVGKRRKGAVSRRCGKEIDAQVAKREVQHLRAKQVGKKAADWTVTSCEGRWQGTPESTLRCTIQFFPSRRERREGTFQRHMLALGEQVAARLGQRVVNLRMAGRAYRLNAPHERGPKPLNPLGRVIR